jgi:hypothetical protein
MHFCHGKIVFSLDDFLAKLLGELLVNGQLERARRKLLSHGYRFPVHNKCRNGERSGQDKDRRYGDNGDIIVLVGCQHRPPGVVVVVIRQLLISARSRGRFSQAVLLFLSISHGIRPLGLRVHQLLGAQLNYQNLFTDFLEFSLLPHGTCQAPLEHDLTLLRIPLQTPPCSWLVL